MFEHERQKNNEKSYQWLHTHTSYSTKMTEMDRTEMIFQFEFKSDNYCRHHRCHRRHRLKPLIE